MFERSSNSIHLWDMTQYVSQFSSGLSKHWFSIKAVFKELMIAFQACHKYLSVWPEISSGLLSAILHVLETLSRDVRSEAWGFTIQTAALKKWSQSFKDRNELHNILIVWLIEVKWGMFLESFSDITAPEKVQHLFLFCTYVIVVLWNVKPLYACVQMQSKHNSAF